MYSNPLSLQIMSVTIDLPLNVQIKVASANGVSRQFSYVLTLKVKEIMIDQQTLSTLIFLFFAMTKFF